MDMQNVSNLQIPEGQVRTIHDKDNRLLWGRVAYDVKYVGETIQDGTPTPDSPIAIKTATGEQLISVAGKNMLDTSSIIWNGSSTGIVTNGNIEITNLSNGNPFKIPIKIPAGTTFTLSLNVEAANGGDCYWQFYNAGGTRLQSVGIITSGTTNTVNRTLSYNEDVSYIVCACGSIGTKNKYKFTTIQIEIGNSKTVFEPFIGRNFPINLDIDNMAPMSDFQIGGMSNGVPNPNTKYQINNAGHPIKVSPNTQYTISAKLGDTVKGMRVGIHSCDANLTFISDSGWKQLVPTPYTFTTGANVEYVKLVFSLSTTSSTVTTGGTQDTTQFTSVIEWLRGATIKMNEGSSVISDIELCKIGNYQDYIYKSGNDWYVHKEINKLPINKTATWSVVEGAVSTSYYYIYTASYDSIPKPSSVDTYAGFCNTFVSNGAYITANTSTDKDVYSLQSGGNNMLRFMIEKSRISGMTSAAVNTFFNNNPTSIYYKLETSTDTQITDATLVGQLNAIHEWMTRYGYNSVVTGNLPIIIDRTNL